MPDEDPLLRIENALRDAAETQSGRAGHDVEHDAHLREIRQLHNSLMVAVGKAGGQRLSDESLTTLIDTVDRIVRTKTF
jgi:hypothetical protein